MSKNLFNVFELDDCEFRNRDCCKYDRLLLAHCDRKHMNEAESVGVKIALGIFTLGLGALLVAFVLVHAPVQEAYNQHRCIVDAPLCVQNPLHP